MRLLILGLMWLTVFPALAQETTSAPPTAQVAPQTTPAPAPLDAAPATPTDTTPAQASPAAPTAAEAPAPVRPAQPRMLRLNQLASASDLPPGTKRYDISSGSELRSFLVHTPPRLPRRLIPLVISFHPAGLGAADQELLTGFSTLADKRGFIVVYPEGRGNFPNWAWRPGAANDQDLQFVADIITHISRLRPISMRALFVSGIGSGAQMAARTACIMPFTFAAVGLVAGNYPQWNDCVERPISVIAFHGTKDTFMPYNGRTLLMGSQGFAERMARTNGCTTGPSAVLNQGEAKAIGWGSCKANTDVLFFSFEGKGHSWPGSSITPAEDTSQAVNASLAMWEFFNTHHQVRYRMPRESR